MNSADDPSPASRLCAQCGLCCNGVIFHTVLLQPADSCGELAGLGLKLKRKKRKNYLLQPCPAHRESRCSIYASRPGRCRIFECRQLKRMTAGEITEAAALEKIRDVQQRVRRLNELLDRSGKTNLKRPLSKRFEKVMAEPLDPSSDGEALALRTELSRAMKELDALLDREFRPDSR